MGEWLREADAEDLGHLGRIDNPSLQALTNFTGVGMPGVSKSAKAQALKDALEWLSHGDPDANNVDKSMLNNLSKLCGTSMPKDLTAATKQKGVDDVVEWLRSNKVTIDDMDDPTLMSLRKLAGMNMPTGGLTPEEERKKAEEERKNAIEDSLDWLRNNDPEVDDVDGPTTRSFAKLAGIPLPKKLTPENKKKTMESAIDWLRNVDAEDLERIDNPSLQALTTFTGVGMPGISKLAKAQALEDALDWVRNNDPDANNVDKPMLKNLSKLSGVSIPKKLTAETKQKGVDDVVDWLRKNIVTIDDVDDPTLISLAKLAGMNMPIGALTPEEERKKAIEESLDWLRNNDPEVDDVDGPTTRSFSKLAGIPLPKRLTPERKKKTMESAIEWLRNVEPEDLDHIDNPSLQALTNFTGVAMPGIS